MNKDQGPRAEAMAPSSVLQDAVQRAMSWASVPTGPSFRTLSNMDEGIEEPEEIRTTN